MNITTDIAAATEHLLDVAPLEKHWLDAALTEVLTATGNMALCSHVEEAALAYPRAACDRAYALGLELGKQEARCAAAQSTPAVVESATIPP